jgi:cytochrome P450
VERVVVVWLRCGVAKRLVKDPNLFDDPETFNPSRFLTPQRPAGNWNGKVESDFTIPFGFGRRVCPGMHVALQSIFISLARYVPKDPFLIPQPIQ